MPQPQQIVHNWVLEQQIGSGSFATVWRARHLTSGVLAALKAIDLTRLNSKLQQSLASEISVLERTSHPNIVGLLELLKEPGKVYLVLEYCGGGDLGSYLRRYGSVPEPVAHHLLVQLADGLKVLRANNLIHRDLKPQNLLLSDASRTPQLKIADFGFARDLQPQGLAETLCGSPLYMAPEILQFLKYDAKADLWSVGAILFELLAGKPPFNGINHLQLLKNIEHNQGGRLPDAVAEQLSPACKQLLHQLLRSNPVERISFEEFFDHPFLTQPQQTSQPGGAKPAAGIASAAHSSSVSNQQQPPHQQAVEAGAVKAPGRTGPQGAPHSPQATTTTGGLAAQSTDMAAASAATAAPMSDWQSVPDAAHAERMQSAAQRALAAADTNSMLLHPYTEVDLHGRDSPAPLPAAAAAARPDPSRQAQLSRAQGSSHPGSLQQQQGTRAGGSQTGQGQQEQQQSPRAGDEDDDDDDDDFVVISGSTSFAPLPALQQGFGSPPAAPPPSRSQSTHAAHTPHSTSRGARAWDALTRVGPALLPPRLIAAAASAHLRFPGVPSLHHAPGTSAPEGTPARSSSGAAGVISPGSRAAPETPGSLQRAHTVAAVTSPSLTRGAGELPQQRLTSAATAAGDLPLPGTSAPAASGLTGKSPLQGKSASQAATPPDHLAHRGPQKPGAPVQPAATPSKAKGSEVDLAAAVQLAACSVDKVDRMELLLRVLHILVDFAKQRWESAIFAAEAAAETAAAAVTQAVPANSLDSTGQKGATGGNMMPQPSPQAVRAASRAAAAQLQPVAAQVLSLQLLCSRIVHGALASLQSEQPCAAAAGSLPEHLGAAAATARHVPISIAASPHTVLLMTHARTLMSAQAQQLQGPLSRLSQDAPLPPGEQVIQDIALSFGRSAAADELLGQHSVGLQQYAKAADLLLFLLLDMQLPGQVLPALSAYETARLKRWKAFFVKKPTCAVHEAVNVLGIIPCYTRSDSHDQQRFTRADSLAARRSSSQNLRAQLRELPMPLSWELATFDGSAAVGPYFSTHLILAFLQGKLSLESRVRLAGHVVWKPLALYYHLLWEESEAAMSTGTNATSSSNNSSGGNNGSSSSHLQQQPQ